MGNLTAFEYTCIPVDPQSKVPTLPRGFKYDEFEYGEDYRDGDLRQAGHVTASQVSLYVIDLDGEKPFEYQVQGQSIASKPNPYSLGRTALGALIVRWMQDGTCPLPQYSRADGENKHHLYVDTRAFGDDEFPVQWATHAWAYDIKAAGFVRAEPVYVNQDDALPWEPTAGQQDQILAAITADRETHDTEWRNLLAQHGIRTQGNGAAAGEWASNDYRIVTHDEVPGTVAAMVAAGLYDSAIHARLEIIMPSRDGSWPAREEYVQEKIDSAREKYGYSEGESHEDKELEFWETWLGLPYDSLVTHMQDAARPRATQEIQREATELAEHYVAIGEPLSQQPVGFRLNPGGYSIEPPAVNDTALGRFMSDLAIPNFRLTADEGSWLENTGTHWERWGTKSERVERASILAMAAGAYIKTDAELSDELAAQGVTADQADIDQEDSRRERLVKARGRFTSMTGQNAIGNAMVRYFLTDNSYNVKISHLDTEPDVLWAGGYPWSLRRPELTFATRDRYVNPVHLKTALTTPETGPTPAFDRLLEAIWPDPAVRMWALREMAGVLLWGATSKMHPVLDGPPHGGKSTFALILKDILGSYAVQVSPDKILGADSSSAAEEEIAAMMGARMVWMDEPPPGGKQAISRFNDLASGTGELSAARKYSNRVSTPKLFNFLICQNPRNALRMDAQGVGERITHIPCDGTPATTAEARENWLRYGAREYPAILAKLIYECAMYRTDNRWPVPHAVTISRDSAQERADEFGGWLLEHFDMFPDDMLTTDARLSNAPTIGALRTMYNDSHARPNALPKIGAVEVKDQLNRLSIRCTTAGEGNSRKKNVVFVQAKPVMQGMLR